MPHTTKEARTGFAVLIPGIGLVQDSDIKRIQDVLKNFTTLLLDADGTWFDGNEARLVLPSVDGKTHVAIIKRRHFHDGQGLSFLRGIGIRVKFVSGEGQPLQSIVEKLNELPSVKSGAWVPVDLSVGKVGKGDKVAALESWLGENNIGWGDCVYMGDDINDYQPMRRVKDAGGVAVTPANATRRIREIADIITEKAGGYGAIREFAELVLDIRGVDETTLPPA